jgi:hypothetical protein
VPRRRSGRFVLEALFLAGVAAAVTVAQLRPAGVIVLMAIAWVIVALLEWTAWLDEPHYGRGLPPRFYVPQVALPPPRAVEQPGHYPVILEPADEPTFVTSVTEWATALEDWPILDTSPVDEETQIAMPDEELDYGFGFEEEPEPGLELKTRFPPGRELTPPIGPPPLPEQPTVEPEALPEPVAAVEDASVEEPVVSEPPPVEEVLPFVLPERVVELPEPVAEPEPAKPQLVPVERVAAIAVHHIDPLASSGRSRLFRHAVEAAVVEVPDGPPPDRMLPGRAARATGANRT